MSRPRKNQIELAAIPRIEKAFWKLLAEKPYSKMTVTDIILEAGIHRNAFYYHFTCLEDMAQYMVKSIIIEDFPAILISRINEQEDFAKAIKTPQLYERYERVCLVAGDNSSTELTKILRDSIRDNWYKALGLSQDFADDELKLAVEFVMGGTMSMLAYRNELTSGDLPPIVYNSEFLKMISGYMASRQATPSIPSNSCSS